MFSTPQPVSRRSQTQPRSSLGAGASRLRQSTPGSVSVADSPAAALDKSGAADGSFFAMGASRAPATPAARRSMARRARTPLRDTAATGVQTGAAGIRAGTPLRSSRAGSVARAAASSEVSVTGAGAKAYLTQRGNRKDDLATAATALQEAFLTRPGTQLVKDDLHAVTVYSKIPDDVKRVLESTDLYYDTCAGSIDVALGFALLATRQECYVWNFTAATVSTAFSNPSLAPTSYRFTNPDATNAEGASGGAAELGYHHLLISWSSSSHHRPSEPGLLLVSKKSGHLHFAESITAGSGWSPEWEDVRISLGYNETIDAVHRLSSGDAAGGVEGVGAGNTVILATSQARFFTVRVVSLQGRAQAQVSPFATSRGFLGRLFGGGTGAGAAGSGAGEAGASTGTINDRILSLISRRIPTPADGSAARYEVMAVGSRSLQRWEIQEGAGGMGHERLLASQDLRQVILSQVTQDSSSSSPSSAVGDARQLEVVDAAYLQNRSLALLYAHASTDAAAAAGRSFGILTLAPHSSKAADRSTAFAVEGHYPIYGFSQEQDSRPDSDPKLVAPFGGPIVYVVLPNAVVAKVLADGCHDEALGKGSGMAYQHVVRLGQQGQNRFVGFGLEGADVRSDGAVSPLPLLTARSGILLLEISWLYAVEAMIQQATGDANVWRDLNVRQIKSQLEAAVYFGDLEGNPLDFAVTARGATTANIAVANGGEVADYGSDGLTLAAEALSMEIATSSSPYLPNLMDLREQLADRLHRLQRLIQVIGENGLTETLPASTRDRLCAEAQLIAAGRDIWIENSALAAHFGDAQIELMVHVVETAMEEHGLGGSDQDIVRAFFRHHLELLVPLFANLTAHLKASSFQEAAAEVRTTVISQVNRILVTAYRGASNYTDEYEGAYKRPDDPLSFERWTSKAVSLEALETAFHATAAVVKQRSMELGSRIDLEQASFLSEADQEQVIQRELKGHLCDLAKYILATYDERLSYLHQRAGEGTHVQERQVLAGRFRNAKSTTILPLHAAGYTDQAFTLAERHQDYATLAHLCTDERVGSKQTLSNHYMDRYGTPFAFELFSHLLREGNFRDVLEQQDAKYLRYVSEYLSLHPEYEKITWLHEFGQGQFRNASGTLATIAVTEPSLLMKKLELSMAKLAYIAELSEDDIATEQEQMEVEKIDDQIDLVVVQESFLQRMQDKLRAQQPNVEQMTSEDRADVFASLFATRLQSFPGFEDTFKRILRDLIGGRVLSVEGVVDVLTLQDNADQDKANFVTALECFVRGRSALPSARQDALLQAFWRRVLLYDDWDQLTDTVGKTDDDLQNELRSTALYFVLTEASEDASDAKFILPLQSLTQLPSRDLISALCSGSLANANTASSDMAAPLPDHFIELLISDYETEIEALNRVLALGQAQWIEETKRIAAQDRPVEDTTITSE